MPELLGTDDSDFAEFVAGSSRRLLGLAYLLSGEEDRAHDLVEGALENAYRRWRRLNREGAPEDYVRRILVGAAMGSGRRRGGVVALVADGMQLGEPEAGDGAAARSALMRAVAALPADHRAALVLRYYADLSDTQVADILGCSVAAVKGQHARAIRPGAVVPAGRGPQRATDVAPELVEVFRSVAASISPSPDLTVRVRRRARDRRLRESRVVACCALVVAVVGVAVVQNRPDGSSDHVPKVLAPSFNVTAANVESMAASGNTLYVAVSAYPGGLLTAYDATSGAELGTAKLPADPHVVALAPDGTVWVTFAALNASRTAGVTEFSPNLGERSTLLTDDRYLDATTFDVVPLGHDRAYVATERGLVAVRLPELGGPRPAHANSANTHLVVLPNQPVAPATALAALSDGNVAVVLSVGEQSRVVLAHGGAEFGGRAVTVAASPEGLWVTSEVGHQAMVRRLSNSLAPLPIGGALQTGPLSGVDRVWTSGRTVWVGTDVQRVTLTCFAYGSPTEEPSATLSLPASDSAEASDPVVSGDLTIIPTQRAVYVASPFNISSYPVPPACRS